MQINSKSYWYRNKLISTPAGFNFCSALQRCSNASINHMCLTISTPLLSPHNTCCLIEELILVVSQFPVLFILTFLSLCSVAWATLQQQLGSFVLYRTAGHALSQTALLLVILSFKLCFDHKDFFNTFNLGSLFWSSVKDLQWKMNQ